MEGESIEIIDIASSSKIEHTPKSGIWGVSIVVIYTGVIPIHHICVGDDDSVSSGNTDNADSSIVSSSSSSYWGITTKRR